MQNKSSKKILATILKAILVLGALVIVVFIYGVANLKNKGLDFIQDESWSHFPGAKVTQNGIHFQPLGRVITHQDGSVGQPNPPVNFTGDHLNVKGDFKITATLLEIDKQASFRLYAEPPIVYDEWRYESPSIDINISVASSSLVARIWDGSSSNSMDMRIYNIVVTPKMIISLEHVKNQINITLNNQTLGNIPDHNIFDSGNIWFGFDGAYGSGGYTLTTLNANTIGTGHVEIVHASSLFVDQNDPNSLRNLADSNPRKIKIGSAISVSRLFTDEQYKNLALSQFSILTPENSLKPQFIHPEPGMYVFEEADQFVDIALKNKMIVHGHTLIYDKSTPDWMIKTPKLERQTVMLDHIKNVVTHFKGKVAEWDVVNEPFSKKNILYKNWGTGLEPNIWYEAMGENYIDLAFKTAHEADPQAKLYLNDYGVERDGQHWDAMLRLVKRLKQRGVPIDGVGFEAHVYTDGDYIDAGQLKKHMETLAGLGLSARISEIDVTGDDPKEQINQYVVALDACLQEKNCTSYTTWGITDRYGSNTRSDRYPLVYGTSLLWDKDMKAKPAFTTIQNRLK